MPELLESDLLTVSPEQARVLDLVARDIRIEDSALHDRAHQQNLVERFRESAGAAFDDLVAEAHRRLAERPGFLVLRGLPPQHGSALLVGVSATLGELVEPYRQQWSKVIRHIVPARDQRVNGRVLNEFLHTDGTDWVEPNDYTCLFCVRPDGRRQGRSRLLGLRTLMEDTSERMQAILREIVGFDLPWRIADELGGQVHWAPAITPASTEIRWLHYTVLRAAEAESVTLDQETSDLLEELARALEECSGITETLLCPGELLIIDNKRCLHSRTVIADLDDSDREILRTKVVKR